MLASFRSALRRPLRRLRRAETAFFDAYVRGGARSGVPLVIPAGWFDRPAVRVHVVGWLRGDHALDTRLLLREWHAGGRREGEPEASFFENLATFVSTAYDLRPHGAPTRRGQPRFADVGARELQ